ncbi:MAG: hypothetical protein ACR2F8_14590 [Caulobacteraceae bacterium]
MNESPQDNGFLDLTAYANDPVDGDWTDILLSAIGAGRRRIFLDGRRFAFAMSPRGRER